MNVGCALLITKKNWIIYYVVFRYIYHKSPLFLLEHFFSRYFLVNSLYNFLYLCTYITQNIMDVTLKQCIFYIPCTSSYRKLRTTTKKKSWHREKLLYVFTKRTKAFFYWRKFSPHMKWYFLFEAGQCYVDAHSFIVSKHLIFLELSIYDFPCYIVEKISLYFSYILCSFR